MKNISMTTNNVSLIGFLGADPVVVSFENGKTVARFSLATHEIKRDKEGVPVEETTWHKLEAWGNTARMIARYLRKGTEIAVQGKIVNQRYENRDGETVKRSVIRINGLTLLRKEEAAA